MKGLENKYYEEQLKEGVSFGEEKAQVGSYPSLQQPERRL